MNPNVILRRIHKLLALAGNAGTEAEAASAAAAAARLMEAHGITRATLAATSGIEQPRERIVAGVRVEEQSKARREAHHEALLYGLSAAFNVRFYWSAKQPVLYGRESAVQTVQYVFAYLTREIDRLADAAGNKAARELGRPLGVSWFRSYRIGAAQAVADTLHQGRRAEVERRAAAKRGEHVEVAAVADSDDTDADATLPVTALIVTARAVAVVEEDEREVAAEYDKFSAKFRHAAPLRGAQTHDAYRRGHADGRSIQVNAARGGLGAGPGRLKS